MNDLISSTKLAGEHAMVIVLPVRVFTKISISGFGPGALKGPGATHLRCGGGINFEGTISNCIPAMDSCPVICASTLWTNEVSVTFSQSKFDDTAISSGAVRIYHTRRGTITGT